MPDDLLIEYAKKFYGFGTWHAKVWFIGIEEAGGENVAEVRRRLNAWDGHGRHELENAPEFYPACDNHSWHREDATLQPTWRQLIRMLFLARGLPDDAEPAMIEYQRHRLGSTGGETCLAELLPLPSPSTTMWNYANWTEHPWFQSRSVYERELLVKRATLLRKRVDTHRPQAVVIYGSGRLGDWTRIMGPGRYERPIPEKLISYEREGIRFFVTKHPADPALRPGVDDYFREIGNFLRANYGELFK